MDKNELKKVSPFELGDINPVAQYFTGTTYLSRLTSQEAQTDISNVTFAPGCINNWHVHHASRSLSASAVKAGIRNGVRKQSEWCPAQSLKSRLMSSTGMAPPKIPPLPIFPLCPELPRVPMNGWNQSIRKNI